MALIDKEKQLFSQKSNSDWIFIDIICAPRERLFLEYFSGTFGEKEKKENGCKEEKW